jgi:hypothetical protein
MAITAMTTSNSTRVKPLRGDTESKGKAWEKPVPGLLV